MAAVTDQMASGMPAVRRTPKGTFDLVFRNASFLAALFVLVLLAGIIAAMVAGGWPAFREFGFGFLTSSVWDTQNEQYGAFPAIVGTLSTALIALVVGVPLSLGIAVFLTQLAPPWFKRPVSTAIELLAAVPSIIYGMWGLFVFVPLFAAYVQIPLSNIVEGMPIVGTIL
jgi:phosphate transport system permease protein